MPDRQRLTTDETIIRAGAELAESQMPMSPQNAHRILGPVCGVVAEMAAEEKSGTERETPAA